MKAKSSQGQQGGQRRTLSAPSTLDPKVMEGSMILI